jgi:hypothetical protein
VTGICALEILIPLFPFFLLVPSESLAVSNDADGRWPSSNITGFVKTINDAETLIEACRQGDLHFIHRRPRPSEQPHSGCVFVFEEKASGIRRWTDGRRWTASRILGDFVIYGEMEAGRKESPTTKPGSPPQLVEDETSERDFQLYGPLAKSFNFPPEGLIKKAICVKDAGHAWHVVSYYRPVDVLRDRLTRPSFPFINQDILHTWQRKDERMPPERPFEYHPTEESSVWPLMSLCNLGGPAMIGSQRYYLHDE